MKRYRKFCFILLALYFLIPLNVAYLYSDFYSEIDLLARKHFSNLDEENLLTFLKNNPRVFYLPGLSIQCQVTAFLAVSFFQPYLFIPWDSQESVLRC